MIVSYHDIHAQTRSQGLSSYRPGKMRNPGNEVASCNPDPLLTMLRATGIQNCSNVVFIISLYGQLGVKYLLQNQCQDLLVNTVSYYDPCYQYC